MSLDFTPVQDIMTMTSVTLRDHQSLRLANARSLSCGEDCLPVVNRDGTFLGLVDHRDIVAAEKNLLIASLRRGEGFDTPAMPLASLIGRSLETLTAEQSLRSAALVMLKEKVSVLPVLNARRNLLGLVTIHALVQHCLSHGGGANIAADFMTRSVVTASPSTTVREAMELLNEASIRHLPVLDKDGRIKGIISIRDLLTFLQSTETAPAPDIPISEFIGGELWTISETDSIASAAQTLADNRFGCLPVVENQRLLGILTESDLLRACIQPQPTKPSLAQSPRRPMPVANAMHRTLLQVSPDQSVAIVANLFAGHATSLILVVEPEDEEDQGRLIGVISKTDLVRQLHTPRFNDNTEDLELFLTRPARDIMVSDTVTCESCLDISVAAQLLIAKKIHSLIVVENEIRIGFFGSEEFFSVVAKLSLRTPISKRMTTMLFDIDCKESLRSALRYLERSGIRSLIVYDGSHPVGLFGQREALRALSLPLDSPVEVLMSTRFLCLPSTTQSSRAAQQAAALGVEQIIVWQAGQAVGILSPSDFFPVIASNPFPKTPYEDD